jgi:hypothetical protein
VEWLIVDEPATNLPSFLLNIHLYTNELRNRLFRVNGIKAFLTNPLHDDTSVVLCQLFPSRRVVTLVMIRESENRIKDGGKVS